MTAGIVSILVTGLVSAVTAFLLTLGLSLKVTERVDQLKNDVGAETAERAAAAVQRAVREATDQRIRDQVDQRRCGEPCH